MLRAIVLATCAACSQVPGIHHASSKGTFYSHYLVVILPKMEHQEHPYNMPSLGFSPEATNDLIDRVYLNSLRLSSLFAEPDEGGLDPLVQYFAFITAINKGKDVENLSEKLRELIEKSPEIRRGLSQEEQLVYLEAYDKYSNFKKDFPKEEAKILRYLYDDYHFHHHSVLDLKTRRCLFDPDKCLEEAVGDLRDPL